MGFEKRKLAMVSIYLILNIAMAASIAELYLSDWLSDVIEYDKYHMIKFIVAVFLVGFFVCSFNLIKTVRELETGRFSESLLGDEYVKSNLYRRTSTTRYICNLLVLLGLLGTVVGFIIALSGVGVEGVSDVTGLSKMISNLVFGMSIALHTTLVGTVLNIWLSINLKILERLVSYQYTLYLKTKSSRSEV